MTLKVGLVLRQEQLVCAFLPLSFSFLPCLDTLLYLLSQYHNRRLLALFFHTNIRLLELHAPALPEALPTKSVPSLVSEPPDATVSEFDDEIASTLLPTYPTRKFTALVMAPWFSISMWFQSVFSPSAVPYGTMRRNLSYIPTERAFAIMLLS